MRDVHRHNLYVVIATSHTRDQRANTTVCEMFNYGSIYFASALNLHSIEHGSFANAEMGIWASNKDTDYFLIESFRIL